MKKQIVKEFITVKKVRYLPREAPPPPPPPARRVLIVGLCTLDIINVCDEQLTPGCQTRTKDGYWRPGGFATNTCNVLRRLGNDCEFLGQLTSAPAFESLYSSFQTMGIDISNCPRSPKQPAHRTFFAVRGQTVRITAEYTTWQHELSYQQFMGAVDYRQYSWIHFESRNFKETVRMILAVRDYNARTPDTDIVLSVDLFDLRPHSILLAAFADYVLVHRRVKTAYGYMNGREIVWAVRNKMNVVRKCWLAKQPKKSPYITIDEQVPQKVDNSCTAEAEAHEPTIIYDNYDEGASCLAPGGVYFKVGAHKPQKIVDTIGEHETFVGAFIFAIQVVKLSLRDAMEYGTRAICLKISKNGFDHLRCMPKDLISCYYA
ncbi:GH15119 [Drosophila grimshawi]|uniref:GH15119 n=1 Tax=Drosophila grimshawi TaxID=7222 RepID=B4IYP6_DROGR|nr:GH15119 [Drosophila grimshawi]